MTQVLNTTESVQRIGFITDNSNNDQIFAITYTNDLFIWDYFSHDLVYKCSLSQLLNENSQVNDYYIVDCFYYKNSISNNKNNKLITVCIADKLGNLKLFQNDQCVYERVKEEKEIMGK